MALKTGIEFYFGFFGSGKSVSQTKTMKYRFRRPGEITASTYWTAYTDIAVRSRDDISRLWWDVYKYHNYIRYHDSMEEDEKLAKNPEFFEESEQFFQYLAELGVNPLKMAPFKRITLSMDEGSVYFNNEHYAEVFKWENQKLLTLLYQPRKIRMHFLIWVQSPNEIHVKFRRLGTDWQYFEKIFWFWRRHIVFYVVDPESFSLDRNKVKEISRSTDFNWFTLSWIFNLPFVKLFIKSNPFVLRFNTDEVIDRTVSVYKEWDLFLYLQKLWKKDLPFDSKPISSTLPIS